MSNQEQQELSFYNYLQSLGESTLLSLVQHYLGRELKWKDKRELISALINFIKLKSTQNYVISLLDQQDILNLQAIAFIQRQETLNCADKERKLQYLHKLLYPMRMLTVEVALQNLSDRLLIYFDRLSQHYCLNPYWSAALEEDFQRYPLFLLALANTQSSPVPLFFLSTMQAILTLSQTSSTHKSWQEAVINKLQSHFSAQFLEDIVQCLVKHNFINKEHHINIHKIYALEQLPSQQALAYFIAMISNHQASTLEFESLYFLITILLNYPTHITNSQTLLRIYRLKAADAKDVNSDLLIQKLLQFQLIQGYANHEDLYQICHFAASSSTFQLRIEGDLSYFYPLEQPLSIVLAMNSTLSSYDTYSHYVLSKERIAHAITKGLAKEDIRTFFATQCDPVSANIAQTLEYWLTSSNSLILYRGTVLSVQPPFLHLLTNQEFLERFVETHISEHVCLLKEQVDLLEFNQFLKQQSIQPPIHYVSPLSLTNTEPEILPIPQFTPTSQAFLQPNKEAKAKPILSASLKNQQIFIERKLILHQQQLQWLQPFRQFASGLDFQAKLRLIDLSIKEKQDLIVIIRQPNGEIELYLKPIHFDKKERQQLKAYDYRRSQVVSLPASVILYIEIVNRCLIHPMH